MKRAVRESIAPAVDLEGLLTIDVEAELRKVPGAHLEGPWQIVSELVRLMLRHGAAAVDIRLGRERLELRGEGGGLDHAVLEALATLMTPAAEPRARHAALLRLEQDRAAELAALAALEPGHIEITASGRGLTAARRGTPTLSSTRDEALRLSVRGLGLDARRARRWLRQTCRFAAAPVRLDGRDLRGAFEDSLRVCPLQPPFRGQLSLPRRGESALVWLLLEGIAAARLTLPGLPCFEAAVEADESSGREGPAAARESFDRRAHQLGEQALTSTLELAAAPGIRRGSDGVRARLLLLAWARHHRRLAAVREARVFPAVAGDPPGRRWLSLRELESSVPPEGSQQSLLALYPGQHPSEHVLPEEPVMILNAAERAALSDLLHVGFHPPRRPSLFRSRGDRLAVRLRSLRRRCRLVARLWPGGRAALADDELAPAELSLLRALRKQLAEAPDGPPPRIDLCSGRGRILETWWSPSRLLLPRDAPAVQRVARIVHADPTWAYPAALALLERDFGTRTGARRAWIGRARQP